MIPSLRLFDEARTIDKSTACHDHSALYDPQAMTADFGDNVRSTQDTFKQIPKGK